MLNSTPTAQSKTSNIAPIVGGAMGGLFFLIGVVAIAWFIRKKCRKSNAVSIEEKVIEEKDVVFPYPVTRGRDQSKQLELDLPNKSRPIEHGFLGRSTQMAGPGRSPLKSHDGWPDSSGALIGVSDVGLTPTTSASSSLATMYGAPTRFGEVWRQDSHNSDPLPLDAAPPDHYRYSSGGDSFSSSTGTISSHRRLLQTTNSPPSSMSRQLGSSSGAVLARSSSSTLSGAHPNQLLEN
jgi:hypothetical protein